MSRYMQYTDEQIDQLFKQLGVSSSSRRKPGISLSPMVSLSPSGSSGRADLSPKIRSTPEATYRSAEDVPQHLEHLLETPPMDPDSTNFWTQFWGGLVSPLTGTYNKLADLSDKTTVVDPDAARESFRFDKPPDPTNWTGSLGKMLGSMAGWTAVSFAVAPIIAPVVGVVATGLAAIGIGATVGPGAALSATVAQGLVSGAVSGAHMAWIDDKPIAPEMLKQMAFGGVMSAGVYGAGHALKQLGVIQPTAQEMLWQEVLKRQPDILDTRVLTPETANLMTSLNSARAGGKAASIVRSSKALGLELTDEMYGSLTKGQKAIFDQIKTAKTLGDQTKLIDNLEKSMSKGFANYMKSHKVDNIWDLLGGVDAADKIRTNAIHNYQNRFEALQAIKQLKTSYVNDIVLNGSGLPSLGSVVDYPQTKLKWTELKDSIKRVGPEEALDSGRYLWNFEILKLHRDHVDGNGMFKYLGKSEKFWDADVLKAHNALVSKLKAAGDPVRFYDYHGALFPVQENVPLSGLSDWITKQTTFPEVAGYAPVSLADTWKLQRPLNWFGANLFPIRYGIGDAAADKLRVASQEHTTFYTNHAVRPIEEYIETLGLRGWKQTKEVGERLGNFLELNFGDQFDEVASRAGTLIDAYHRAGLEMTDTELNLLSKELGVPKTTITKALDKYLERAAVSNHGKLGNLTFDEYLERLGSSPDKYIASWLKQDKLYYEGFKARYFSVDDPTGIDLKPAQRKLAEQSDEMAKSLGLTNARELKVAYKMRKLQDSLFEKAGFDPMEYQVGYLPRFREMDGRGYDFMIKAFDEVGLPKKMTEHLMWTNQMHREVSGFHYTYETNAFAAHQRWVSGYSKQNTYEPVFRNINKAMERGKAHPSRIALYTKVQDHLKGVPTEMEATMDRMIKGFGDALNWKGWNEAWGPKPTREMTAILGELQVMGGLGFNPFAAVKNTTQKILAFSSITEDGNPLRGLYYFAKANAFKRTDEGKWWLELSNVRRNRVFYESLDLAESSLAAVARRMGAPNALADMDTKFRNSAMSMFKTADLGNIDDTFLAKLLAMREAGSNVVTAVSAANQTVMATQFMYGFDSPMLYKSTGPLGPLGRAVGVFTSWPLNWAHLLYTQGTAGEAKRALSTVVSMAVASEILSLSKWSFQSIHPADTASGLLPIAALEGADQLPMLLRSGATALTAFRAFREGDFYTVDAAIENFKNRMWLLVPAGSMAKKVWDIIDIAQMEWRKTRDTGEPFFAEGLATPLEITDKKDRLNYHSTLGTQMAGVLGPTIEQKLRYEDYVEITKMEYARNHMRRQAIDAFMVGDLNQFQKLQELLVINFNSWVSPKDIKYEMQMRGLSARERQAQPLPLSLRQPLMEKLQLRHLERLGYTMDIARLE